MSAQRYFLRVTLRRISRIPAEGTRQEAHGLGNALVLPHTLELMKNEASEKLADIAVHCGMGERSETAGALAQKLINGVWALNEEIGIPRTTDVIREDEY